jgi:transposase
MGVGFSTIGKWVKQFQQERQGARVKPTPMTPEQLEIRELKKRNERLELEKEILKKATALLMSDSMNCSGQLQPDTFLKEFSNSIGD